MINQANILLKKKHIPFAVKIFIMADIGLCFLYVANFIIGRPIWELTMLVDLGCETSVATWYSSMKYFCIFFLSAIMSYQKIKMDKKAYAVLFLPIIFLLMSIDEIDQIHEWLGRKSDILFMGGNRTGTILRESGTWLFAIGIPFIALFFPIVFSLKRFFTNNHAGLKKLAIGMIIMLTGALGFEFISNFAKNNLWYVEVFFEEGFEMAGATVLFWAIYDLTIGTLPEEIRKYL